MTKEEKKEVLENITFKTQFYRKNYDLINNNENIITECNGIITQIKISDHMPPLIIGEYGFSIWNIELGNLLDIDIKALIKLYWMENTYDELSLISSNTFNIYDYRKIVFIHGLVITKDYRKLEITEEFIEGMYRDFYSKDVAIIALVKPLQDNYIDSDYYFKHKMIHVRKKIGLINDYESVPASEYYSLTELRKKEDTEINEYKLFSVAAKCGFKRIDESHLFIFSPENMIERIKLKNCEKRLI